MVVSFKRAAASKLFENLSVIITLKIDFLYLMSTHHDMLRVQRATEKLNGPHKFQTMIMTHHIYQGIGK